MAEKNQASERNMSEDFLLHCTQLIISDFPVSSYLDICRQGAGLCRHGVVVYTLFCA